METESVETVVWDSSSSSSSGSQPVYYMRRCNKGHYKNSTDTDSLTRCNLRRSSSESLIGNAKPHHTQIDRDKFRYTSICEPDSSVRSRYNLSPEILGQNPYYSLSLTSFHSKAEIDMISFRSKLEVTRYHTSVKPSVLDIIYRTGGLFISPVAMKFYAHQLLQGPLNMDPEQMPIFNVNSQISSYLSKERGWLVFERLILHSYPSRLAYPNQKFVESEQQFAHVAASLLLKTIHGRRIGNIEVGVLFLKLNRQPTPILVGEMLHLMPLHMVPRTLCTITLDSLASICICLDPQALLNRNISTDFFLKLMPDKQPSTVPCHLACLIL